MTKSAPDLIVLHEHPEWQKPLFAALEHRGVSFLPFDVTRGAFNNMEPRAYFSTSTRQVRARICGVTRARFHWPLPVCDRWSSWARGS